MSTSDDAATLLMKAGEARQMAADMHDPRCMHFMLVIAANYEAAATRIGGLVPPSRPGGTVEAFG